MKRSAACLREHNAARRESISPSLVAAPQRHHSHVMRERLRELGKKVAFRYTRLGVPRYPYSIEPIQLATLVQELDRVRHLEGSILEVGVARGMTTRFLCEHLVKSGMTRDPYYAIDTFESFNRDDIRYEIEHRGKSRKELMGFQYNHFETWKRNFEDFPFVTACKADCSTFDYSSIAPIKVVLLDVDLYLPTKRALHGIYTALCPEGVVLVDDVKQNFGWDGAYQAYTEFCAERNIPPTLIGSKCGVIRKQTP